MSEKTKKSNITDDTKKPLSEQQLKELQAKAVKFYSDELPALRLEAEYEQLNAEIEESKVRTLVARGKSAYIYAQAEANAAEANVEEGKEKTPQKK